MTAEFSPKYIHGYQEEEQQRLRHQALVIEKRIYDFIDFSNCRKLLEIGSGVGAQTEILLKRFPSLHITGVEYEPKQIIKARENMTQLGFGDDQVIFIQQDAKNLQLEDTFDGAFICWVLEHVSDPIQILVSMKPFLKAGAKLVITEVFNTTFYTYPEKKEIMEYWKIYNDYQSNIGGDPQVGARLGDLLSQSGYQGIELRSGGFHLDSREFEEKRIVFDYWKNLMESASPALLEEGLIDHQQLKSMQEAMDSLKEMKESVFYYRFIQATAFA
ncbi:class I SAM-dependent methyltransferase [Rhodonellum sp.]|uniref:class I SAM-dependent methyltransferase n=1 Tax=Rhodonellum sp. TaxID=2231180 RepID=UPI002718FCC1|nr:class I SAM-dependent methyltransferase [Rhodonellum sp.]MDO9552714.1 methyltransferase domain-containing protein [Rhodonellum sp.]